MATSRSVPLLLCLAGFVLGGGCADAPIEGEPYLELGTGTFRFVPVEDGEGVPLIRGAQGGWHLWVSVRAFGLDVEEGGLEITHQPVDESFPPSQTRLGVRLDPPDVEGGSAYLGWPAILRDPACSVDTLYRLEVAFRPASGGRLVAEREVLVLPGDLPPPPCEAAPPE